ncbi:oligopeptide transport system, permease [Fictibacillus macauensis ZFHKF-1]|uniref:Oligopeptide transport system, permease n=1 Tax=Fictibacillus macauensis ZFHKF-1 TaxID=1196324 RepID=I8IXV4_9BACL|nr:ABC transporter permease subunit [Fictibacillus macauensis]EIT84321.1 oligopeptide transport system, permease [Fictibacillus macauensis ZFHKF-1]
MIGLVILSCLLISSFALTNVTAFKSDPTVYGPRKAILYTAPYPPSAHHWFGTDDAGEDMLVSSLRGVKETIGYALAIAICRLLISTIFGVLYGLYAKKSRWLFQAFFRPFRFIPAVLLAVIILTPFKYESPLPESTLFWIHFITLVLIALPVLTEVIGEELHYQLQQEYIIPSKMMGASRFHLLRKHLWPYFTPRLKIHFIQQVTQALILMLHLSIFLIALQIADLTRDISNNYTKLMTTTWEIYTPVLVFFLCFYSFHLLVKGVEQILAAPSSQQSRKTEISTTASSQHDFTPLHSQ